MHLGGESRCDVAGCTRCKVERLHPVTGSVAHRCAFQCVRE